MLDIEKFSALAMPQSIIPTVAELLFVYLPFLQRVGQLPLK